MIMNEMTAKHINEGETSMKKTLIVIALAMALVFAFASPAFAKYAGFSASSQYVTWTVAAGMASQNPDAALQGTTPHGGYATTTIKCAVCHSVHRGSNKLLLAGNSCAYCHTNAWWGGASVATGLVSWYGAGAGVTGTYASVTSASPHSSHCYGSDSAGEPGCHGGVHGIGGSAYAGPQTKMLNGAHDAELVAMNAVNGNVADLSTWSAQTRALATGSVCQECHGNSMFSVVTAGATKDVTIGAGLVNVTGHRVIATDNASWNGATYGGVFVGKIAWAPVAYCDSCHDLEDDNNSGLSAFPHAINGVVDADSLAVGPTNVKTAVWLTAGAYAGAPTYAVSVYNDYAGGGVAGGVRAAAGATILDGLCLKCHRGAGSGTGDSGVGYDF
jgi:hypothetical protein